MEMAVAMGATAAWGHLTGARSEIPWHERRDIYPEGVASGDPDSNSLLLWTRCPVNDGTNAGKLVVELAEDESFHQVVATTEAQISEASDWTCRVLVGGLKPARIYWYRFTDANGNGSRVGRAITPPNHDNTKPLPFAFSHFPNATHASQHAYQRMIFDD